MGSGAEYIHELRPQLKMSPLGAKVADLIDSVWCGIYHVSPRFIDKVDWSNDLFITMVVPAHGLATYDFERLTQLVVLCHESALRMEVGGANPRHVRLTFHQRGRSGSLSQRHPSMAWAVSNIRETHPHFLEEHEVMG